MEVKIPDYDKKSNKLCFVLKNSDVVFANAIRRTIIDEVPTMAIEDVEFRRNNSVLYDEVIAHRLGLIPLKTDLKSYNLPSKCKCEGAGCARCQVKLILRSSTPGYVYASELKSQDPKISPVYPEMPIAKLLKGQKIELEAVAVLGKGKEHAKFSPGHAYYKYKQERKKEEKEILFYAESWGQLICKEIVDNAAEILIEQLEELDKELKKK